MLNWIIYRPPKILKFLKWSKVEQILAIVTTRNVFCFIFGFVWVIDMQLLFTCKYLLSFTGNAPLEGVGVSFRSKLNIFISVSGQFLITTYMIQPKMKLFAGVVSLHTFWQKWNFISGDKTRCKHCPKWNHLKENNCTCVNKIDWLLLNRAFINGPPPKRYSFHFGRNKKERKQNFFYGKLQFQLG